MKQRRGGGIEEGEVDDVYNLTIVFFKSTNVSAFIQRPSSVLVYRNNSYIMPPSHTGLFRICIIIYSCAGL